MHLGATDGFISLPNRGAAGDLYVFGFVEIPEGMTLDQAIGTFKGQVQNPAPIIGVDQFQDLYLSMSNLGFVMRPDLDDAHTVHWHGFPNQTAIFDGVPEVSISVPPGRTFPYFYRPRREGSYMYHCHFEDTEHVQMGMDGIIYVRPAQNTGAVSGVPAGKYAYNDGDGSTAYDREFALLLNEIWSRPHDNLVSIQETVWSDYDPNYWVINGRTYPDTIAFNGDPSLAEQPISSLMQVNAGDRVLMRIANLGYHQNAMELPGVDMRVVGEDATLLRGPNGADLTYVTNAIYVGPGEARDVLFTAPAHSGGSGPDKYLFRNRRYETLNNNGAPGGGGIAPDLGGMATEVWVYPSGTLPDQTEANETYA
jgi:FtsP/CotA-like multicopper oxidase with cupredoxin domain